MYVKRELTWTVVIDVDVQVKYRPATPDVMYLRNGDPGYPGDPAEVEFLDIYVNGQKVEGEVAAALYDALDADYDDILMQVEEELGDDSEY